MVRARRSISDVSSLIVVDESDARALHDGVVLRVLVVHELATAEEELHGGHRDLLTLTDRLLDLLYRGEVPHLEGELLHLPVPPRVDRHVHRSPFGYVRW